jgi:hypothetical protein
VSWRSARWLAQIGPFVAWRSTGRIGLASLVMYGSNILLAGEWMGFIPLHITGMIGMLIYAVGAVGLR